MFYLYNLCGNIMCADDDQSCLLDGSGSRIVMVVHGTSGSVLELRSLVIINGYHAGDGGGLYIIGGAQVSLVVCSIQRNEVTSEGGGIYVVTSDTVVDLYGVSFSGNTASDGADIYRHSGTVTVYSECSAGEN